MAAYVEARLSHRRILLDPNNPRFLDSGGYVRVDESRIHEEIVQTRTFDRLKRDEGLGLLRASILSNGWIPVERLVVKPYGGNDDSYVVIEGNRRLAAVRWLIDDYNAGVTIPDVLRQEVESLPVIIIEPDSQDPVFIDSLLGVRHVMLNRLD